MTNELPKGMEQAIGRMINKLSFVKEDTQPTDELSEHTSYIRSTSRLTEAAGNKNRTADSPNSGDTKEKKIKDVGSKLSEGKAPVTNKDDDGKGMDPVGKGDADIDNDGDSDKSDRFLKARRKAISRSMAKESVNLDEISQDRLDRYRQSAHRDPKDRTKGRETAFNKSTGRARVNPPESKAYNSGAKMYPKKKASQLDESIIDRLEKLMGKSVKPNTRLSYKGYPFDLEDSDGSYIDLEAVDSDAAKGLGMELKKAGFKVKVTSTNVMIESVDLDEEVSRAVQRKYNLFAMSASRVGSKITQLGKDIDRAGVNMIEKYDVIHEVNNIEKDVKKLVSDATKLPELTSEETSHLDEGFKKGDVEFIVVAQEDTRARLVVKEARIKNCMKTAQAIESMWLKEGYKVTTRSES